jgi:hypothetical protein
MPMRRLGCVAGSTMSALALIGVSLILVASAAEASGFHCSENASRSFAYKSGIKGQPAPSEALTHFLRTGSDGLRLPLSGWTHPTKNLFAYSSPQAIIRVTTYRIPKGSYVVVGVTEFCMTHNPPNGGGAP